MFGASVDISQETTDEIIRRLYKEAEPGMDYDDVDKPRDGDHSWYELHYLDDGTSKQIIRKVCEEEGFSDKDTSTVVSSILLKYAPSSSLEKVNEARKEEGLEPAKNIYVKEVDDDGK